MSREPRLLPVRLFGDEILKKKLPECNPHDPAIQDFIPDLIHTMYERDGVGLAANQVGSELRMFVIDPFWAQEGKTKNPIVMINPVIESSEGEVVGEEGCISLPGIYADVHRSARISYSYTDEQGNRISGTAEDFKAVVIQHEFDHLEGIVFTDRISTLARLRLKVKLKELASHTVNGKNELKGIAQ